MYCLHIDESGTTSADTVFVMSGLLVDTRDREKLAMEFDRIFTKALDRRDGKRREFKASKFIRKGGMGLELDTNDRREFIKSICNLAISNNRRILGIGISFDAVELVRREKDKDHIQKTTWIFSSMFTCALLQNRMQKLEDRNQKSVIEFDNHSLLRQLSNRLKFNCDWYDGLYRVDESNRFDRIVNKKGNLGVDSRNSPLVQAADAVAYVYRRYLELCAGQSEREDGEREFIQGLIDILEPHREKLGNLPSSDCLDLFKKLAHPSWTM